MNISDKDYKNMQLRLSKLDALAKGSVHNWECYGAATQEWRKDGMRRAMVEEAVKSIRGIIIDGVVWESQDSDDDTIGLDEEGKEAVRGLVISLIAFGEGL